MNQWLLNVMCNSRPGQGTYEAPTHAEFNMWLAVSMIVPITRSSEIKTVQLLLKSDWIMKSSSSLHLHLQGLNLLLLERKDFQTPMLIIYEDGFIFNWVC